MKIQNILTKDLKSKIEKDENLLAVILFGSYVKGKKFNDIDICIVMKPQKYEDLFLSEKRLEYLSIVQDKYDIQIFQQLPLYIKIRILKEGKIIFCKNEDVLYEIAINTIKDFDGFKKHYYEYLRGVAHA